MMNRYWTRPRWLYRYLARRAIATIVTNEHFAEQVRSWGGRSLVITDIPTTYPVRERYPVEGAFNIMVVCSYAFDEPVNEIMAAAEGLNDVMFYVTGDARRLGRDMPARVPSNVRLTGFLPDDTYYSLMAASDAVMCLTTRDNTMQRGASEALSMGKPILTSRWPLLARYFCRGTVHVDNSPEGIRAGIQQMVRDHSRYRREVEELQIEKLRTWDTAIGSLVALINQLGFPGAGRSERAEAR
jgi:glycosyltransferase involved in cell wall biosynthesis